MEPAGTTQCPVKVVPSLLVRVQSKTATGALVSGTKFGREARPVTTGTWFSVVTSSCTTPWFCAT